VTALPSIIRVPGSKIGHLPAWGRPWGNWTVCHRPNVESAVTAAAEAAASGGPSICADVTDVDRVCGHCAVTLAERRRTQDAQLAAMGKLDDVCAVEQAKP